MRPLLFFVLLAGAAILGGCEQDRPPNAANTAQQPCNCDAAQGTPHQTSGRTQIIR